MRQEVREITKLPWNFKMDKNNLGQTSCDIHYTGLPQSGKNIWKMKFFPGQQKVREYCGWSEKFRKDLESQGKVREFENKWLWQTSENFFILFKRGKDVLTHEIVKAHLPPQNLK